MITRDIQNLVDTQPPANSDKTAKPLPVSERLCYVRVRNILRERFVEFDFAIGSPELYVELVMPKEEFDDFCVRNKVIVMSEEQAAEVDRDMEKWRYGKDGLVGHHDADRGGESQD